MVAYPRIFESVVVNLVYLRRNRVQEESSTQVNKIRYVTEQVIGNMKTWRMLHTDYRHLFQKFEKTDSAVISPHFHKLA